MKDNDNAIELCVYVLVTLIFNSPNPKSKRILSGLGGGLSLWRWSDGQNTRTDTKR